MHRINRTFPIVLLLLLAAILAPATATYAQDATPTPVPEEEVELTTVSAQVELSNQLGNSIISARGNHFIIGSAPPLGHPYEEIAPVEAMLGALATCGLFVYEAAAAEMNIALTSAQAAVQADWDARGLTGAADVSPGMQEYRVHFDLEGPDADQAEMLAAQFMTRCPIYTTLAKTAPINITTNEEEMAGPVAEGLVTSTVVATLTNQPGRAIFSARDHFLAVDSPALLGGPNLDINPLDLLLGAQISCGAHIMESAATANGIPFRSVHATVEADFDPQGMSDGSVDPAIQAMRVQWEIDTQTPEEAQFFVDQWLARCPIYATLSKAMEIEVSHKLMGQGTALLNIVFAYDVPTSELQAELAPLAEQFAASDGLLWM
ncbi:MAG: OsmC family protein, partial [Caldilineaceae bacterium]|nr:OsmC family protein [Caldilineaceae bacterium]